MFLLFVVVVFAVVGAVLYLFIQPTPATPAPAGVRVAELARLTYAAAIFALLFSLALGTHDAILRVVK